MTEGCCQVFLLLPKLLLCPTAVLARALQLFLAPQSTGGWCRRQGDASRCPFSPNPTKLWGISLRCPAKRPMLYAEKQGDGSKTAAACVRQGFAGNKSPAPHLWHGGDVCVGGRTENNKEDEGTARRDPKGRTVPCQVTSLHPCGKISSSFFWGGSFLLTQSVGEGFLSTLLRVEVAVMVLA